MPFRTLYLARLAAIFLSLGFLGSAAGQGKLSVVTTLTDLAAIVQDVGGDQVSVFSIATGYQNPHFVDPKPSYIIKLSRADMFVTVGLDLESGWVPPLLNSARNRNILPGSDGYVDASTDVPLLQIPTSVSRDQGDIHVYGNPHYWLDPDRGRVIAQNVYAALVRLRPGQQALFAENLAAFNRDLDEGILEWHARLHALPGRKIVAYHDQWPYFEHAFGLQIVEFLEPRPGIPPTPSQLAKVITTMERESIGVIIISPYFKPDAARLVARKTGSTVVTLASSVGAFDDILTYRELFDYNVELIALALEAEIGP